MGWKKRIIHAKQGHNFPENTVNIFGLVVSPVKQ